MAAGEWTDERIEQHADALYDEQMGVCSNDDIAVAARYMRQMRDEYERRIEQLEAELADLQAQTWQEPTPEQRAWQAAATLANLPQKPSHWPDMDDTVADAIAELRDAYLRLVPDDPDFGEMMGSPMAVLRQVEKYLRQPVSQWPTGEQAAEELAEAMREAWFDFPTRGPTPVWEWMATAVLARLNEQPAPDANEGGK